MPMTPGGSGTRDDNIASDQTSPREGVAKMAENDQAMTPDGEPGLRLEYVNGADWDADAAVDTAEAPRQPAPQPVDNTDARREALLDRVAGAIAGVHEHADHTVDQWQSLAVRFAGVMVKQLVGNSDAMQTDRLKKLVNELVQLPELPLRMAAHPDDCPLVQESLDSRADLAGKIQLVADPTIAAGECRAAYADYELVSRLEGQLPDIEYRLQEALRND